MIDNHPSQVILDQVPQDIYGCLIRSTGAEKAIGGLRNERRNLGHDVGEPHHARRSERFERVDRRTLASNGSLRSDLGHVVIENEDLTIHGISEPAWAVLDYARWDTHASPLIHLSNVYELLELALPLIGAKLLAEG